MTSEELRERKRELMARKKYELELQEQGKGDNFALFMVNEELLDVNAQLRALAPAGKGVKFGRKGRTVNSDYGSRFNAGDRQQFIDWARQDSEEVADDARAEMRKLLHSGLCSVSPRQREMLLLWNEGLKMREVAERLGVDPSTVSRTIKRAKKTIARMFETQEQLDRLRDGNRLDVSDPEVAKLLLSALTPHQAVCFYLYFAEWLSFRQIGKLLGLDHATVCRVTHRAIGRINDVLGWSVDVLEDVEGLDDVVFAVYCGMCERGEELPPDVIPCFKALPDAAYLRLRFKAGTRLGVQNQKRFPVPIFRISGRRGLQHGRLSAEQHGKLFQALHERYRDAKRDPDGGTWSHPITRWLVGIFRAIATLRDK